MIIWELGEGLGHLGSFPLLTEALIGGGHRVLLVMKDLAAAYPVLGHLGADLLQAPTWQRRVQDLPLAASYAEILLRVGYLDHAALTGHLRAWRDLFELAEPDLILLNHSPTALLASRRLGVPRIIQGTGFTCPAVTGSRPTFPLWARVAVERPAGVEARLLEGVNQGLGRVGVPALRDLGEMLDVQERFLCTLPGLDPYRGLRVAPDYLGPVPSQTAGLRMDFPDRPGPRVFAYLKRSHSGSHGMLRALARSGASVLAYVSGASGSEAARWSSASMRVCDRPLQTEPILAQCDLVVHHGGHGVCADAMLAGAPSLVLPLHVENWVNGRSLEQSGAGWVASLGAGGDAAEELLARALADQRVHESALQIARSNAGLDRASRIGTMARRIEGMLEAHGKR